LYYLTPHFGAKKKKKKKKIEKKVKKKSKKAKKNTVIPSLIRTFHKFLAELKKYFGGFDGFPEDKFMQIIKVCLHF
jgi:hypothetical protein